MEGIKVFLFPDPILVPGLLSADTGDKEGLNFQVKP